MSLLQKVCILIQHLLGHESIDTRVHLIIVVNSLLTIPDVQWSPWLSKNLVWQGTRPWGNLTVNVPPSGLNIALEKTELCWFSHGAKVWDETVSFNGLQLQWGTLVCIITIRRPTEIVFIVSDMYSLMAIKWLMFTQVHILTMIMFYCFDRDSDLSCHSDHGESHLFNDPWQCLRPCRF